MKEPCSSYRVVQRVVNKRSLECQYVIFNADNEPCSEVFSDHQAKEAYDLCWSWLTAEEQSAWLDYRETMIAHWEVEQFQERERRLLACDR